MLEASLCELGLSYREANENARGRIVGVMGARLTVVRANWAYQVEQAALNILCNSIVCSCIR